MSTSAETIEDDDGRIAWDDEGCPYLDATGEYLAPDDPRLESSGPRPLAPRIETREDAERALEGLAAINADLVAISERRNAYLANLNRQIGKQERRIKWWEYRNRAGVIEVAKSMLGAGRTADFDHGRVRFRTTRGTRTILDMAAAVAYVRDWAPDRVKVEESVTLKAIEAARESEAFSTGESPPAPPFVAESGPGESVKIDTGVYYGGDQ